MAKEVIQRITDDLDGSPDAATIQFALDGKTYEIDLGPRNEAKFRDALAPFVDNATRVRAEGRAGLKPAARGGALRESDRERAQLVRQWALDNGVELPARGRVAQAVLDAFDDNNVPALYEATGLEYEPEEKPKRSRRKATEVEFSES